MFTLPAFRGERGAHGVNKVAGLAGQAGSNLEILGATGRDDVPKWGVNLTH
jgi:hypothetical protein